ncbi:MAG: 2-amino-4-hydroxy-6-hydroxymethyldihydropteridine diphosphokinase [Alphaproteobacteria bacterium]|nr:2-amino-4-hydroxy-6-hydroxymethyldihydropteridine diphosphokinase [Alphaproteobacteria bacterium]
MGLGANLESARGVTPRETLEAALDVLGCAGVAVEARSPWYLTAPVPRSDQPDYVNGVARISSTLSPESLLALLHEVEDQFGRVRVERNEARVLDLDLIDYRGDVREEGPVLLPHPRAAQRAFVLVPLRDLAPEWRHPVTGEGIDALIARLPDMAGVRRL